MNSSGSMSDGSELESESESETSSIRALRDMAVGGTRNDSRAVCVWVVTACMFRTWRRCRLVLSMSVYGGSQISLGG